MPELADQLQRQADEYRRDTDEDRPLGAYTGLLATYGAAATALAVLGRRRLPGTLSASDLALGSVVTFRLARTLTEDTVTSPLRAAFTRYEGVSGPSELREDVRGTGWRHAVGELLTCPFCMAQWTATLLIAGMSWAPRTTRTFMSVMAMVAGADFLQFAYAKAQQMTES